MYERLNSAMSELRPEFIRGVREFIQTVKTSHYCLLEGGIRCPCAKCRNMKLLGERDIKTHLYKHGFMPNYWIWTRHGEEIPVEPDLGGDSSNVDQGDDDINQFDMMHDMVTDAFRPFVYYDTPHRTSETIN